MAEHTALITGASAGLGEQFAQLFAKNGFDVVLVARAKDRLDALARKLTADHKINAHVLPFDLIDPGAPQNLFDTCNAQGLKIDHLVNNAGFGSQGVFVELDLPREAAMIEVNCTALLKLTHLFALPMKARGFGRILNVASTAAFQPGPYMATYYASKAFVLSFSEALAYELKGSGVTVTAHCPGATATEFALRSGNDQTMLFKRGVVASAREVADHAYRAMMRGEVVAIHGAANAIGVAAVRLSPRAWVRAVAARFNLPVG